MNNVYNVSKGPKHIQSCFFVRVIIILPDTNREKIGRIRGLGRSEEKEIESLTDRAEAQSQSV